MNFFLFLFFCCCCCCFCVDQRRYTGILMYAVNDDEAKVGDWQTIDKESLVSTRLEKARCGGGRMFERRVTEEAIVPRALSEFDTAWRSDAKAVLVAMAIARTERQWPHSLLHANQRGRPQSRRVLARQRAHAERSHASRRAHHQTRRSGAIVR
jgi:hypothetical protein